MSAQGLEEVRRRVGRWGSLGRGEEDVRNHATGRKGRADMLYPFGKHHQLQGFVSAKAHHDKIRPVLCHFICVPSFSGESG